MRELGSTPDAAPPLISRSGPRPFTFALVALLGGLVVGLMQARTYQRAVDETFRDLDEKQLYLAEDARDRVRDVLNDVAAFLENTELLDRLGLRNDVFGPDETANLDALHRSVSQQGLVELLLVEAGGTTLGQSPRSFQLPPSALLSELSQQALREPEVLTWSEEAPASDASILLARPLRSDRVLVARIPLARLYAKTLAGLGIGPTGYAWAIDQTGAVLMAPPPSRPGSRPFDQLPGSSDFGPVLDRMRTGRSGFGRYTWSDDEGRDVRRVAFTPFTFLGRTFVMAESASEREVVGRTRSVAASSALVGGAYLGMVVIAGALVLFAERQRRRRTEELVERVAQSERKYRAGLDESPAAILELNPDTGVLAAQNQRSSTLLERDSVAGVRLDEIVSPDQRDLVLDFLRRLRDSGHALMGEIDLLSREGTRIPVELSGRVIGGEGERVAQLVAMDLRDRRAVEDRLRSQQRLATLGVLTAGIAHELRSPVGYVLANAEQLKQQLDRAGDGADPEQSEMVEDIVEGANRLRRMVSSLGVLGREPKVEVIRASDAIGDALRVARHELRYRTQVATRGGDEMISGSRTELVQVLLNLLVNAAQAFDPKSSPRENLIEVVSHRLDSEVEISVSDNGPGIAPGVLPHIFERFFTTKPAVEGNGLGLWLARSAVERMGGTLDVESLPGQGATFRLRLPADREGHPAENDAGVGQGAREGRGNR